MKKFTEYFRTTVRKKRDNNKKQLKNNISQAILRFTNTIQNQSTMKNNAFENA